MAILNPPQLSERSPVRLGVNIIALAACVALLYFGRDFFITLIIAGVFAVILDPLVELVMKLRVPRGAATPIVIGVAFVAIYLLGLMAWTQVATIREDLPTYTSRVSEVISKANDSFQDFEKKAIDMVVPANLREQEQQIEQKPKEAMKARRRRAAAATPAPTQPAAPPAIQEVRIHRDQSSVIAAVYTYISGYFHIVVMASFVPFLVYFMLSWRDHIGKGVMRLFRGDSRYVVGKSWIGIADSTRAYVLGNFFLWVFLSSVSAVAYFFLGVPYWPLIGPISAFFSLVPYVGLPLSIVPPVVAALAIPNKFKIVLIIILVASALHVIAMNFLYAKIIGRRVRLNPLIVTVALMFWGMLWGGIGLILAVPITAGIKAVCDNVESLQAYGRLLGD